MELNTPENILKYWYAFESFNMPDVHTKKDKANNKVEHIIKNFTLNQSFPWPLSMKMVNKKEEIEQYHFNIYLGIILKSHITDVIVKKYPE